MYVHCICSDRKTSVPLFLLSSFVEILPISHSQKLKFSQFLFKPLDFSGAFLSRELECILASLMLPQKLPIELEWSNKIVPYPVELRK